MSFNDDVSTPGELGTKSPCYSERLAQAIPTNIEEMKRYVRNLIPHGKNLDTSYFKYIRKYISAWYLLTETITSLYSNSAVISSVLCLWRGLLSLKSKIYSRFISGDSHRSYISFLLLLQFAILYRCLIRTEKNAVYQRKINDLHHWKGCWKNVQIIVNCLLKQHLWLDYQLL